MDEAAKRASSPQEPAAVPPWGGYASSQPINGIGVRAASISSSPKRIPVEVAVSSQPRTDLRPTLLPAATKFPQSPERPSRRRRNRCALIMLAIVILGATGAFMARSSHPVVTTGHEVGLRYTSAARTLPDDAFGIDGDSIRYDLIGQVWNDPSFASYANRFNIGNIRIFGGSTANFWNWQTGQLLPSAPGVKPNTPNPPIRLSAFQQVLQGTHAATLFNLNVMTESLDNQIQALKTAQSMGIPIARVELGNELWLPTYTQYVPTALAYAQTINSWISTLHQDFPGVQVAVVGEDDTLAPTDRQKTWNAQVFASVHGEDAVTLHEYARVVDKAAPTHPSTKSILAAADQRFSAFQELGMSSIPHNLPIWVSEWGYQPTNVSGFDPWAHALGDAYFGIRLATQPRVQLADFHSLVDSFQYGFGLVHTTTPQAGATLSYQTTAAGHALGPLFATLKGCKSVRLVGTYAPQSQQVPGQGLIGVACVKPTIKVFILNTTSTAQRLDVSALFAQSAHLSVGSFSAPIDSDENISSPAVLNATSLSGSSLTAPAWSVLRIGG